MWFSSLLQCQPGGRCKGSWPMECLWKQSSRIRFLITNGVNGGGGVAT